MSAFLGSVLAGAGLGLSIAAPIGPTSMLCVQRTLAGGLATGLATGFGVATVHLTYGTLMAQWGAAFAAATPHLAPLSLVSGTVLLAFAIRTLRSVPILRDASPPRRSLAATYGSAVGLALTNPITPVLFMAAMPAAMPVSLAATLGPSATPFPGLVAGVFLGSLGWWIALNTLVSVLRRHVASRLLDRMNKVAGLLLAAIAVSMLVRGFSGSLAALTQGRTGAPEALPALVHQVAGMPLFQAR